METQKELTPKESLDMIREIISESRSRTEKGWIHLYFLGDFDCSGFFWPVLFTDSRHVRGKLLSLFYSTARRCIYLFLLCEKREPASQPHRQIYQYTLDCIGFEYVSPWVLLRHDAGYRIGSCLVNFTWDRYCGFRTLNSICISYGSRCGDKFIGFGLLFSSADAAFFGHGHRSHCRSRIAGILFDKSTQKAPCLKSSIHCFTLSCGLKSSLCSSRSDNLTL